MLRCRREIDLDVPSKYACVRFSASALPCITSLVLVTNVILSDALNYIRKIGCRVTGKDEREKDSRQQVVGSRSGKEKEKRLKA